MKKTEKINIKGFIFHVDDDAYDLLKKYLDSLSRHFVNNEEGSEIIDDIERRIAELFQVRIKEQKEVITIEDVKEIIEILGNPAEIDDHEGYEDDDNTSANKRLYRDPDNSYVGGVSSGIAYYINVDPVWIRAAFILLTFFNGLGILIYLVLWLVVPPAKTRAQKLEMKGKKVNIENIERSIQNEFDNVKQSFSKFTRSEGFKKTRDGLAGFFEVLGNIIVVILKVALIIVGVVLVLAGVSLLFGLFGFFTFREWFSVNFPEFFYWPDINHFFEFLMNENFVYLSVIVLILIPVLSIIYWIIKGIFNIKVNDKPVGITLLVLWIIGFILVVGIGISGEYQFFSSGYSSNSFYIEKPEQDTLYLDLKDQNSIYQDRTDDLHLFFNYLFVYRNGRAFLYGKPELRISRSQRENIVLTINKKSYGENYSKAQFYAEKMSYSWFQKDTLLLFDQYFVVEDGRKWRVPQLHLDLDIPEDLEIVAEYEIEKIVKDIDFSGINWKN